MAGFNGWQAATLRAIGAPLTANNLKVLQAWQQAEGGSASFNPLNTTQPASGAGSYNGVGVRNYRSAQQGVDATAQTLLNGHYGNIVNLLRSGRATPAQVATAVAQSPWGTGSGVLRVLGAGSVSVPKVGRTSLGSAPPTQGSQGSPGINPIALSLLAQAGQTAQGDGPSMGGLLALAIQRQQQGATQDVYGSQMASGGAKGGVSFTGDVTGENPGFLKALSAAASAAGATHVRIISGYRSAAHNAAIGGAQNSLHTRGAAMDGTAFVPGKGWVPLGQLILPVAGRFGLRSGDQPGFFHGTTDPNHVDFAPSL